MYQTDERSRRYDIRTKIIIYCFSPSIKILNRRPLPSYNKLSLHHAGPPSDTCSLYKVSLNQELLNQYVEYEKDMPDLKEFTLCMWTKFHNHSQDHPLFSYSGKFCLNIFRKIRHIFGFLKFAVVLLQCLCYRVYK